MAAAEARTQEYEARLREAKAAIFKGLEARRQAAQHTRDAAIAQAREVAQQQIRQARAALEQEMVRPARGCKAKVSDWPARSFGPF